MYALISKLNSDLEFWVLLLVVGIIFQVVLSIY